MPLLLIILVALLVANIGFWDALAAMLGAVAVLVVFFVILVAAAVVGVYLIYRRVRG